MYNGAQLLGPSHGSASVRMLTAVVRRMAACSRVRGEHRYASSQGSSARGREARTANGGEQEEPVCPALDGSAALSCGPGTQKHGAEATRDARGGGKSRVPMGGLGVSLAGWVFCRLARQASWARVTDAAAASWTVSVGHTECNPWQGMPGQVQTDSVQGWVGCGSVAAERGNVAVSLINASWLETLLSTAALPVLMTLFHGTWLISPFASACMERETFRLIASRWRQGPSRTGWALKGRKARSEWYRSCERPAGQGRIV